MNSEIIIVMTSKSHSNMTFKSNKIIHSKLQLFNYIKHNYKIPIYIYKLILNAKKKLLNYVFGAGNIGL